MVQAVNDPDQDDMLAIVAYLLPRMIRDAG